MIQDSNLVERVSYVENGKNLYSCKHPISFQKAILKQVSVVFSSLALLFRLSCSRVLLTQVLRPSNSRHPVSNQQKPTHQTIVHGRFVVFAISQRKPSFSPWSRDALAWCRGDTSTCQLGLTVGNYRIGIRWWKDFEIKLYSLLFITWHKMQHLTTSIEYCSNKRKQAINPRANSLP